MTSRDIERAEYLKRLFQKQLDKANPKKSHEGREKEAIKKMDEKLGTEWRHEISRPELDIVQVEVIGPPPSDVTSFYDRVSKLGDEEGLGDKGSDAPEEHERADEPDLKDKLMCALSKVLDKIL